MKDRPESTERSSPTEHSNGHLLGLALAADDVGDGARVDAAVLDGGLRDGQGVADLLKLLDVFHRFDPAIRLSKRKGNMNF